MKILSNNNFYYVLLSMVQALAIALCASSCDSFVEVPLPKSQLASSDVFNTYSSADAALTDIYSKMRDQGLLTGTAYGLSYELGNYADELVCYAAPGDPALPYYNNSLLAGDTSIADSWNFSYNQIYAANAVIEGVKKSSELSESQKTVLEGEALFIRSIIHFYLTSIFGDVPYVTSTDYKINNTAYKIAQQKMYQNIALDLELACTYLKPAYISSERTRPNLYAAKALLARVYLYEGKYPEASNSASAVLNQTDTYNLNSDLSSVFLKESQETIWQFQPSQAGKNTDEAASFIFFEGPPPASALSNDFVASFESLDQRKTNWIQTVSDGTDTWYCSYKYKEYNNTEISLEFSIILRLAEQYLIRAEARAHQGDLIGAMEDLNKIRNRAGLASKNGLSKSDLLVAILQERKSELFTEYGHRFFDLKRSGQIDAALLGAKPGWNTNDVLFPLPQNELGINPNLRPQNSGY